MSYEYAFNEISASELLEYLKRAYGCQINGSPFSSISINNWLRQKAVPQAYGGYKILMATRYKALGNLLVLTLDGFNREEMEALVGSLCDYEETKNRLRKQDQLPKESGPRKKRTRLYYQFLKKGGKQWTKKTLDQAILPLYYKEAGVKQNQLPKRKAAKKK
jgi:hypothetical protein